MPFDPTTKTSTTSTTPNPMLQHFEEHGCEIAFEDPDHYLACQNHFEVVKYVIQKGGGPKMHT